MGLAMGRDEEAGSLRPKFVVEQNAPAGAEAVTENTKVVPSETGQGADRTVSESAAAEGSSFVLQPRVRAQADLLPSEDGDSWRREVSERLHRYHARRRPRAPRYPSLRLKFDAPETNWAAPREAPMTAQCAQPATQPAMRQSVAVEYANVPVATPVAAEPAQSQPAAEPRRRVHELAAKVIEFPRTMYAPTPRQYDLAEAILDRPRILEAPEIVPPPPALGGLTIEETTRPEPERRVGIDMPLQSALLEERLLAVAIDVSIVAVAAGGFGCIFYKMTSALPPLPQLVAGSAALLAMLWAAYQYLLVVYAGTTPGLRALRLSVQRFDGKPVSRRLRRWRVLGSMLSGISLGMGYAWHFLDEDGLCWHERVTKTHLANKH
jgi:uncharacterized RDD family membrane protein YckC